MLIRSQDKKTIKCFGDRDTIYILDSRVFIDGSAYGVYSTEEKAIKVLGMIERKYSEIVSEPWENTKVFQMPQDSEV